MSKSKNNETQLLWAGMGLLQMALIIIGYVFILKSRTTHNDNYLFFAILAGMGVVNGFLSRNFYSKAKRQSSDQQARPFYLVSYIMAQTITIFGIILPILGYGLSEMAILCAASLGLWFRHRPVLES